MLDNWIELNRDMADGFENLHELAEIANSVSYSEDFEFPFPRDPVLETNAKMDHILSMMDKMLEMSIKTREVAIESLVKAEAAQKKSRQLGIIAIVAPIIVGLIAIFCR